MITSQDSKKTIRQNTFNISFRNNNEERNMYHQILRRSTLTSTPISKIVKEYVLEGVKNDKFLQMFN